MRKRKKTLKRAQEENLSDRYSTAGAEIRKNQAFLV